MKTRHCLLRSLPVLFLIAASVAPGQVRGPNGHFYHAVIDPGLLWEEAREKAAGSSFNGVPGHLATVSTAEEDAFIEGLRREAAPGGHGSLWIGGSQPPAAASPGGGWAWVNNEGAIPAQNGGGAVYANWQPSEPNDYQGPQSESYLSIGHFNTFGWNDEADHRQVEGYVVEYPSPGPAATVRVTTPDPVAVEKSPGSVGGDNDAIFEFSRSGDLSGDLRVYYSIHGSAQNGHDYNTVPDSITIPSGQPAANLVITPRADALTVVEPMETVGIRLEPPPLPDPAGAVYDIDPSRRRTAAVIHENGPPHAAAIDLAFPGADAVYQAGEPVPVMAVVHFPGAVPSADFHADGVRIGSAHRSAGSDGMHFLQGLHFFEFTWNGAPAGRHALTARAPAGGALLTSRPVSISVEEPPGAVQVSIRYIGPSTTEPWPDADFAPGHLEISRTGSITQSLRVHFTVGGTAVPGADYEPLRSPVVIEAGSRTVILPVNAKDDLEDEPQETVSVTLVLSGPEAAGPPSSSYYVIDPNHASAEAVILDNDEPPQGAVISIHPVNERTRESRPGEDAAPAVFMLRRSGPAGEALPVFLTCSGTAAAGSDYLSPGRFVQLGAGQRETRVELHAKDDSLVEGDETVVVGLEASAAGAPPLYQIDPANSSVTLIISDNDAAPAGETVVRIEAVDSVATEFPGNVQAVDSARFLVTRTGDPARSLLVFFSLHGTAENGEDYRTLPGSVSIPAGQSSVAIEAVPVSDSDGITNRYEVISSPGISWEQARREAEAAWGYLATITSAAEDEHIESLRQEAGGPVLWVGGYQEPWELSITSGWKWVNNEGPIPGDNSGEGYANWLPGEPNDYWGPGSENHMVIGWLGTFGWNDQTPNIAPAGYVMESPGPVELVVAEPMETLALRLEPSPAMNPLPDYTIDEENRTAAAVIFELRPPESGAVEVAFPGAGAVFLRRADVEFHAAVWHPSLKIQRVEYFVDGQKAGSSLPPDTEDPAGGGVTFHHFRWAAATSGRFTLQVKAVLTDGQILSSSQIPFTVENDGANQSPVAGMTEPEDGAVFPEGDAIEVRVEASDPDGTIARIDLFLDSNMVATASGPSLQFTLRNVPAGVHTLYARAFDSLGAAGITRSVRILVRHPHAVAFVHRRLPGGYTPGVPLTVELQADPPDGTHAFAVEDQPPGGWRVDAVSHDGVFDPATGKIKFGPFTDAVSRSLTYRLTPPANASGPGQFSGSGSVNGALYPVAGDHSIALLEEHHPADRDENLSLTLPEVTAYAAAWKAGGPWTEGPVPIPVSWVTAAGLLWRQGEAYHFDAARSPAPACWVSDSQPGVIALIAEESPGTERHLSQEAVGPRAAVQVRITVTPRSGTTCHAVEESPPSGWTVSGISHGGAFDKGTGVIRWGVFFDSSPRTLTYSVTPPAEMAGTGHFRGRVSVDGHVADIRSLDPAVSFRGAIPVRIDSCTLTASGAALHVTGPAGQTAVIEGSGDLSAWTQLKSIFIPEDGIEFTDHTAPASGSRFYRLRIE
ncbi:MAG: outer rane adhesin like protein [Verrucomicrobiales bacterium]|nr:outer rane adhesin like protein [Verrucomicrobiales bacterium]